ncbi:hypothetical protein HK405_013313, partial [Cladochytrium tenue]
MVSPLDLALESQLLDVVDAPVELAWLGRHTEDRGMHAPLVAVLAAAAATAGFASAQACQPDVLVDDFRPRTPDMFRTQDPSQGCTYATPGDPFNGCNKTLNLLGGDYGDAAIGLSLDVGSMTLVAGYNPNISDQEAASHPHTAPTFNYWFVKFNWENDFDISPYTAMAIDLVAPSGSDFNVTLTQWLPADPTVRNGKGNRTV